jgi:hypothetical protein
MTNPLIRFNIRRSLVVHDERAKVRSRPATGPVQCHIRRPRGTHDEAHWRPAAYATGHFSVLALVAGSAFVGGSASAGPPALTVAPLAGPGDVPSQNIKVVAQAQPRECWVGVGIKPLPIGPHGTCPQGGRPRTTSDYLWGVTLDAAKKNIWWGTFDSITCNLGTYAPIFEAAGLHTPNRPFTTDDLTCEFDKSWAAKTNQPYTAGVFGDIRPAQVYQYNIATGKLIERTPSLSKAPRFNYIGGLRAAGALEVAPGPQPAPPEGPVRQGGLRQPWERYVGWGAAVFRGKLYWGGTDVSKLYRDVIMTRRRTCWRPCWVAASRPRSSLRSARSCSATRTRTGATRG